MIHNTSLLSDEMLAAILISSSYITEQDAHQGLEAVHFLRMPLMDYFIGQGMLTRDLIGQAIAEYYKIPYLDLNSKTPTVETILLLPEEFAKLYRAVLVEKTEKEITVSTSLPEHSKLDAELKKLFPTSKISITFSLDSDIDRLLSMYRSDIQQRFKKIIDKHERVAPELIEEIVSDAVAYKASDVHFEPQEDFVLVRFRIDGVLQEAGTLPPEYFANVINKIKILAKLRIDNHFNAQDGSIRMKIDSSEIDLRVSIIPTIYGEKAVMRILSSYVSSLALTDVGLSTADSMSFSQVAARPFGMIIVSGPTGSGKTTTLYALLRSLHKPGINITTIEDPVEYKIPGINQIQVNNQTGLTFASGLRSIVRQDPDVILVGEVRDHETAEIAVNAALTGHMVLTTFHANDAATTIPRLFDMGVEPFLLASTLELIVAQRLVRKICETCKKTKEVSVNDLAETHPWIKEFTKEKKITLYEGAGCTACNQKGYRGRIGVFELIVFTPELRDLILKHPSGQEIAQVAKTTGAKSLFMDGIEKVFNGLTTIDEIIRVVGSPNNIKHEK